MYLTWILFVSGVKSRTFILTMIYHGFPQSCILSEVQSSDAFYMAIETAINKMWVAMCLDAYH